MPAKIEFNKDNVLSDNDVVLRNMTYVRSDGAAIHQRREVQERDNGAAILLYSPQKKRGADPPVSRRHPGERPRPGGVEDEDIEVLELPFARKLEMFESGESRDDKTVFLLNYLSASGLME